MRNYRKYWVAAALLAAALVSCSRSAEIEGTVSGLADGEIVVKQLDVNVYNVLDTIRTDASGKFSYKVQIEKGQPEFIYLFRNERKLASLLLDRGEKVSVAADTIGNYTVAGSVESVKLSEVEKAYSEFSAEFMSVADRLAEMDNDDPEAVDLKRKMAALYTDYYRGRVKYILGNAHSLTVVPVLYQTIGVNLPVFSQETDAIHFSNACDSLETVYPDSKYVKALRAEAKRRNGLLMLNTRIKSAEQLAYPDLNLPDVNSAKVRLSDVKAKVVLLHFWSASDPSQKMFNLDVLKPVYRDFHSKGLEIYQVAVDADKALWARTVKDQNLDWINVCDGLGAASPVISTYNLAKLPVSFVISEGNLVDGRISDEASLRRLLEKLLK